MTYTLYEYGDSAGDRSPVEGFEELELTPQEAAEMNRRMVRTPCRVLPRKEAKHG